MNRLSIVLAIALLSNATLGFAQEGENKSESKIVGAWQEGLTGELRKLPAEALNKSYLSLGDVLVINADHTLYIYPRCGKKMDDLRAKGLEKMEGRWTLLDTGTLQMKFEHAGKSMTQSAPIKVAGDDLWVGPEDKHPTQMGRYTRSLPPVCPQK